MHGAYSLRVQPSDPNVLRGPIPTAPMRVVDEPKVGEAMVFVSVDRTLVVRTSRVLGFLRTAHRLVLRTENSLYTLTRVGELPAPLHVA